MIDRVEPATLCSGTKKVGALAHTSLFNIQVEQDDGSFATIYQNTEWGHPLELWMHVTAPWKDQDPPVLPLRSGQKIRFTCEWQNFTDGPVRAGVRTTDEMCFVLGYYWREDEGAPIRVSRRLKGAGASPPARALSFSSCGDRSHRRNGPRRRGPRAPSPR